MRLPPLSRPTVVHVVRHAEKQRGRGIADVGLADAGRERASDLPRHLDVDAVAAVFVTPYRRTRQTAQAVLERTGLEPEVYPANDISSFVVNVARFEGQHVLIVGHCDTVPHILEGLGVSETVSLTLADYGDLFTVRIADGEVSLARGRFGP